MKNRNAERRGMKTKVEFYKAFFEELEKKGFGVAQPSSPDYVVDIQFKGKTIAFYTKVDMIEKNPFVEVPEKQMERLWSMARAFFICQGRFHVPLKKRICQLHPR